MSMRIKKKTINGRLTGRAAQLERAYVLGKAQFTAPAVRCQVCNEPLANPRNTICGGCWTACNRLNISEGYASALVAAWDSDWPHRDELGSRFTINGGEVLEIDQPATTASPDEAYPF